jgi:hypothetical protein
MQHAELIYVNKKIITGIAVTIIGITLAHNQSFEIMSMSQVKRICSMKKHLLELNIAR